MTRHMPCSCCGGTGSCRTDRMSKAGKSARAITSIRIWRRSGSISKLPPTRSLNSRRNSMILRAGLWAAGLGAALAASVITAAVADEEPKRGGALTYMIPADGPPSFDGHREATYATAHSAAPYYSVLIRVNPDNPGSASDFVCDLCTAMPRPTDDGRTYTFKIRDGVRFHDGSPLTAYDVAASWNKIINPPEGVTSARQSFYIMVDKIETPDPIDRGLLNAAVASRCNVKRIVDGATPTRRAISLSPTPALLKRSTSRTRRIGILSAGIRSPVQKPKERTLLGPAEASPTRARSSRNGGRNHLGTPGEITSEC